MLCLPLEYFISSEFLFRIILGNALCNSMVENYLQALQSCAFICNWGYLFFWEWELVTWWRIAIPLLLFHAWVILYGNSTMFVCRLLRVQYTKINRDRSYRLFFNASHLIVYVSSQLCFKFFFLLILNTKLCRLLWCKLVYMVTGKLYRF